MLPLETDLMRQMYEVETSDKTHFTRRMAINIADFFGLPPMSMVWQLEKRGIAKKGSWSWFKDNGGITKDHIHQARTDRK